MALVDLDGIDDPSVRRQIVQAAYLRGWRFGDLLILVGIASLGGIFTNSLVDRFVGNSPHWIGSAVGVIVAMKAHTAIVRRRMPAILPPLLKSLGRCSVCGYQRESSQPKNFPCPECGARP